MIAIGTDLIQKTPGVCGGSARAGMHRITVWNLVNSRRLGASDSEILAAYDPPVTPDELRAAWEYYELNRAEIDEEIRRNESDDIEEEVRLSMLEDE